MHDDPPGGGSDAVHGAREGGADTDAPAADTDEDGGVGRRDLLKLAGGGAIAAGMAAGGYLYFTGDPPTGEWTAGGEAVDRETVTRFAPVVQFGAHERWYPTDPREYAADRDGETVVDGFAALDGYTAAFREAGTPPAPVAFYRTLAEETSQLGVIQYWLYSAFDQFAVNFHWHDWELIQVFFDRESGEAVLVSASSHSRRVPNNEHLGGPDGRMGILAEVGSHSSATDIDRNGRFVRVEAGDLAADVTNALVRIAADLNPLPLAYGLPRGEGAVLPYVVPELEGNPLYEHPDLPNVRAEDLVDEPLAIRDLASLTSPPADVPRREPGLRLVPAVDEPTGEDEVGYELEPVEAVADAIDDFAGPQLSFEFAVPGVVEDRFASHITSVGLPWEQPRYDQPLADVTDGGHRQRVTERFGVASPESDGETVVAQVQEAEAGTGGELRGAPEAAKEELEPEIGYTLTGPTAEAVVRLESEDPVAVPTAGGALRLTDVDPGEHRLLVDGAGYAPHAERLRIGDDADGDGLETTDPGTTRTEATPADGERAASRAGDRGYVTTVPREDAVKLRAEAPDAPGGVERVRVAEDYAGTAFDGRPATDDDEDGFAVYVHREGSYVVDVVDEEGVPGTARVEPGRDDERDSDAVDLAGETGKAPLAEFLAEYFLESADLTRKYRREEADDGTTDGDVETGDDGETTTTTTEPGGGDGSDAGGGTPTDPTAGTTEAGDGTTRTTGGDDPGGGGAGGAGVPEVFESAAGAAERAAEFARDDRFDGADRQLETVRNRLDALRTRIEAQRGGALSDTLATVLRDRVEGSDRRARAALEADR